MKILFIVALFLGLWFWQKSKKQAMKILFIIPQKFPTSKIEWEFLRFSRFLEQTYPNSNVSVEVACPKNGDRLQIVEILCRRLNFQLVAKSDKKNYHKIYNAGGNWQK